MGTLVQAERNAQIIRKKKIATHLIITLIRRLADFIKTAFKRKFLQFIKKIKMSKVARKKNERYVLS